jgi:hypothetical protein
MKKIFFGIGILVLLGAGCAPADQAPGKSWQEPESKPVARAPGALQPLPEVKAPKTPIDDSGWERYATKAGIVVNYPTKGGYSPTWSYRMLMTDDPQLKGVCYEAADAVYERTLIPSHDDACQTTTSFDGSQAGTRTDYFAFRKDGRVNLLTFIKEYPAGFDMDEYSATLDHIIGRIE